jgi:hypothetical protein
MQGDGDDIDDDLVLVRRHRYGERAIPRRRVERVDDGGVHLLGHRVLISEC